MDINLVLYDLLYKYKFNIINFKYELDAFYATHASMDEKVDKSRVLDFLERERSVILSRNEKEWIRETFLLFDRQGLFQ